MQFPEIGEQIGRALIRFSVCTAKLTHKVETDRKQNAEQCDPTDGGCVLMFEQASEIEGEENGHAKFVTAGRWSTVIMAGLPAESSNQGKCVSERQVLAKTREFRFAGIAEACLRLTAIRSEEPEFPRFTERPCHAFVNVFWA